MTNCIATTYELQVEQWQYKANVSCRILYKEGLGSCIGIAVGYGNKLFLCHFPNASYGGAIDDFFAELESNIPDTNRLFIRPVVTGGQLGRETTDMGQDRDYVLDKLISLGFGKPHLCWCGPKDFCQDLSLDTTVAEIKVTTYPKAGSTLTENAFSF
ncbi:hypothetical protein [Polaromonas naphthalenivorans]|nr:hypothetical protein [Polaromonas naphthalenivorans]